MPLAELKDARIYFEMAGEEHLPVLVLSNSLGASLEMWQPQMPDFSSHFRVLRYDARGHSRSSVTPGPYSIAQLSADLLGLLDNLHIERAHFCGLSMGGMIGQTLGVTAPDRLGKLVLANTAAKIGTPEGWNARIELVRNQGMRALSPGMIERWYTPEFAARAPEIAARTCAMLDTMNPEGYIANCAAVRDMDQREAVSAIRVPTLVIAGARDSVTPPSDGRFLAGKIAGAQYIELAAAHLSNVEASSEFTSGVVNFLTA